MHKYLTYFKMSLVTVSAYKADFFLYMAINLVFFYISIALWSAVYTSSGITEISTYTLSNTITYYLITTILFRLDLGDSMFMAEEIWNGYFSNDLIKPWNVIGIHFMATLSDLAVGILSFLPFLLIIIVSAHEYINLPSISNVIFFLITVILGLIMNFVFNLILHSFTFHFGDQYAQIQLVNYITSFLAGGVFPLSFLSGWLGKIMLATPFKYLFFIPAEIFLGKMSVNRIVIGWIELLVWIMIFWGLFYLVYTSGLKKYSGTGR